MVPISAPDGLRTGRPIRSRDRDQRVGNGATRQQPSAALVPALAQAGRCGQGIETRHGTSSRTGPRRRRQVARQPAEATGVGSGERRLGGSVVRMLVTSCVLGCPDQGLDKCTGLRFCAPTHIEARASV